MAFNRPANGSRKEKKQQVKPALRLPADRYLQPLGIVLTLKRRALNQLTNNINKK
jgi:hypothetical protein